MLLSEVKDAGDLTVIREGAFDSLGFLDLDEPNMLVCWYDEDFLEMLLGNKDVTCVITREAFVDRVPDHLGVALAERPMWALFAIHEYLIQKRYYWTDFDTEVAPDAVIHPTASIAPKNVRIGSGSTIMPNATILEHTIIGKNVWIGPGTVVAAAGFHFEHAEDKLVPIPHAGGVKIEDNVAMLANVCISKHLFGGFTEIGEYTALDNLVNVAHNVRIGKRCIIAAGAAVSGNCRIEDDVYIGPNATLTNSIAIGEKTQIALGMTITRNVPAGTSYIRLADRASK
jgi:UDP-3-O-[3-hydroxymyristoyl] glucosamine N-acyltransferase